MRHDGNVLVPLLLLSHSCKEMTEKFFIYHGPLCDTMVTMVTMAGDLQPGCLADRLLTGLGQPQIYP